eukprot:TRINITY_DN1918_c0_g1_i1.p1 TRINITY_DN1918_c0_g1~~TRINITY_DN1918_c0_g1_i1.p1  ORF type:complete len:174 (-),score=59.41 TRINITY_DN1918_c0_g1_i1:165-686(-)
MKTFLLLCILVGIAFARLESLRVPSTISLRRMDSMRGGMEGRIGGGGMDSRRPPHRPPPPPCNPELTPTAAEDTPCPPPPCNPALEAPEQGEKRPMMKEGEERPDPSTVPCPPDFEQHYAEFLKNYPCNADLSTDGYNPRETACPEGFELPPKPEHDGQRPPQEEGDRPEQRQ